MRISTFAATDAGQVRRGNEDSYFRGATVVAVADGLGGHQAGEVASATAIEPVAGLDKRTFTTPEQARDALVGAIKEGNNAVIAKAMADSDYWGMGTTMTAAAVAGDRWLQLAHVGDSRAYLLRAGRLRQLTDDHTIVAELVRQGRLTAEEAAHHPERSILTRAVGLDPALKVDTPPPLELEPGDQLLLCSDGLTEPVAEERIVEILRGDDGRAVCHALVDAANAAGGPDNVTVVLLRAAPPPP
ncbi:MAG TPA: Stp1/IreP family PP2C-type Ser/Thr phosphatase [Actinomycetes bacterium]|jgi:protein phosphatase|nr:Stp1/IreP family PP2C-type Ser/Thr phosphatase [Actinomycetes bacterium]